MHLSEFPGSRLGPHCPASSGLANELFDALTGWPERSAADDHVVPPSAAAPEEASCTLGAMEFTMVLNCLRDSVDGAGAWGDSMTPSSRGGSLASTPGHAGGQRPSAVTRSEFFEAMSGAFDILGRRRFDQALRCQLNSVLKEAAFRPGTCPPPDTGWRGQHDGFLQEDSTTASSCSQFPAAPGGNGAAAHLSSCLAGSGSGRARGASPSPSPSGSSSASNRSAPNAMKPQPRSFSISSAISNRRATPSPPPLAVPAKKNWSRNASIDTTAERSHTEPRLRPSHLDSELIDRSDSVAATPGHTSRSMTCDVRAALLSSRAGAASPVLFDSPLAPDGALLQAGVTPYSVPHEVSRSPDHHNEFMRRLEHLHLWKDDLVGAHDPQDLGRQRTRSVCCAALALKRISRASSFNRGSVSASTTPRQRLSLGCEGQDSLEQFASLRGLQSHRSLSSPDFSDLADIVSAADTRLAADDGPEPQPQPQPPPEPHPPAASSRASGCGGGQSSSSRVPSPSGSVASSASSNECASSWHTPEETLIVLDWDDTLCPTTFIGTDPRLSWKERCPCYQDPTIPLVVPSDEDRSKGEEPFLMADALQQHETVVREFLESASKRGKVVIVTLAQVGWVDSSVEKFLPGLREVLDELQIEFIYARQMLTKREICQAVADEGDVWQMLKEAAFRKVLRAFYGRYKHQSWKNVLGIGDSATERDGLIEVMFLHSQIGRRGLEKPLRCKTVKLPEEPDLQILTQSITVLQEWLEALVWYDGDITIDLEGADSRMEAIHDLLCNGGPRTESVLLQAVSRTAGDG